MKTIRSLLAVLLFALSGAMSPASATSFTTDQSDLWWNANESGWGMQLVQRGSIIFATIFVYDQTRVPIWYSATLTSAGGLTWVGDLYLTSGPWFGTVPFNASTVTQRKVGTITWTGETVDTGSLNYSVDGVFVAKNLVRQPIVADDFSGHYGGGIHQVTTSCANPGFNGTIEDIGVLNIVQNGAAVTLQSFPQSGGSCSFPGTLTQAGQMGTVSGSYVCSDGRSGSFQLFEMQVNITGLTGRLVASSANPSGCQTTGWFGGLRVTTF